MNRPSHSSWVVLFLKCKSRLAIPFKCKSRLAIPFQCKSRLAIPFNFNKLEGQLIAHLKWLSRTLKWSRTITGLKLPGFSRKTLVFRGDCFPTPKEHLQCNQSIIGLIEAMYDSFKDGRSHSMQCMTGICFLATLASKANGCSIQS